MHSAAEVLPSSSREWAPVCPLDRLPRGGGVAAMVDGWQVAILRTDDGAVHAIDNRDPFTHANVLSRGIVGTRQGVATVASPLRKQRFALDSGRCLDDPAVAVVVHEVRLADGWVQVRLGAVAGDPGDTRP